MLKKQTNKYQNTTKPKKLQAFLNALYKFFCYYYMIYFMLNKKQILFGLELACLHGNCGIDFLGFGFGERRVVLNEFKLTDKLLEN